jgi:hypothetical protein
MANPHEPVLDEIQWRAPELAQSMGGIHTNTGESGFCGGAHAALPTATADEGLYHSATLLRAIALFRCHLEQRYAGDAGDV